MIFLNKKVSVSDTNLINVEIFCSQIFSTNATVLAECIAVVQCNFTAEMKDNAYTVTLSSKLVY